MQQQIMSEFKISGNGFDMYSIENKRTCIQMKSAKVQRALEKVGKSWDQIKYIVQARLLDKILKPLCCT